MWSRFGYYVSSVLKCLASLVLIAPIVMVNILNSNIREKILFNRVTMLVMVFISILYLTVFINNLTALILAISPIHIDL